MQSPRRHLIRISLCAIGTLLISSAQHGQSSIPSNSTLNSTLVELPMNSFTSGKQPRLRRLHLVRPDLIPYPLQSEFVC